MGVNRDAEEVRMGARRGVSLGKVREAILLSERLRVSSVRGGMERLSELAPAVEEALTGRLDADEWSRAALALVLPYVRAGRFREMEYFLREARARAEAPETRAWADIYWLRWQGTYGFLEGSVETWRGLDAHTMTPLQRVYANYFVARTHQEASAYDEAVGCLEVAVEVARRHTLSRGLCMALHGMGMAEQARGNHGRALELFEEAYALNTRQLGDPQLEVALGVHLGAAYLASRRYTLARECIARAGRCATEHGLEVLLPSVQSVASNVDLASGRYEDVARRCAEMRAPRGGFVSGYRTLVLEAFAAVLGGARPDAPELVEHALRRVRHDGDTAHVCMMEMLAHVLDPEAHPLPEYVPSMVFSEGFFRLLGGAPEAEVAELEARLNAVERDLWALHHEAESWSLWAEEGFWRVSADGREWVDMRRRANARALLEALHEAYPESVGSWALFERVWPEVVVRDDRVLGRLYTCVYRLRGLGLDGVVENVGQAYRLSGPVKIVGAAATRV
jgi:tetratricopeptide (TPR) repeat protein